MEMEVERRRLSIETIAVLEVDLVRVGDRCVRFGAQNTQQSGLSQPGVVLLCGGHFQSYSPSLFPFPTRCDCSGTS